ncbi:Acetyltransferase involved in cellulose biosynthesis, CelD/BcsL family [Faunimonas pinastri]|uniref:Acetyltransferase involved in cellulose biosynthesis, CelD/BcsL family n=1 Tax=Faunimonas pinastri TaxID=1855383 RepID=A0A1H9FB34_9HYPH|nr:GNAT family N-acetyltransferase [Faunimonas pinastri]SEQ35146.1 Acetyltransferase involved in cellulose biosynthesis, CelD/BcsL family [Faunimonas pinastri]
MPPALPHAFDVAVATSAAELKALRPEWLALEEKAVAPLPFQSFGQISTWLRHQPESLRLRVVVVRENGRAALILPLALRSRIGLAVARMAGEPVAQYADVLLDPEIASEDTFRAALGAARAGGLDAIEFTRVRADSHLARFAALLGTPEHLRVAPYADVGAFGSYDGFLQTLSKNTRKSLRNRRNNLDRQEGVAFAIIEGGAEARAALAACMALKREWLQSRGAISSAFRDPLTSEILLDLAEDHRNSGSVVLTMHVAGRLTAIYLGFEYRGTFFTYMSAYDPDFSDLSPGRMLLDHYLATFPERNMRRLDLLPPDDGYKREWCSAAEEVADYTLALSPAGRLYRDVYRNRVRPVMRQTWARLPESVRGRIVARLLKV